MGVLPAIVARTANMIYLDLSAVVFHLRCGLVIQMLEIVARFALENPSLGIAGRKNCSDFAGFLEESDCCARWVFAYVGSRMDL